jgi:hypothetical protein
MEHSPVAPNHDVAVAFQAEEEIITVLIRGVRRASAAHIQPSAMSESHVRRWVRRLAGKASIRAETTGIHKV